MGVGTRTIKEEGACRACTGEGGVDGTLSHLKVVSVRLLFSCGTHRTMAAQSHPLEKKKKASTEGIICTRCLDLFLFYSLDAGEVTH